MLRKHRFQWVLRCVEYKNKVDRMTQPQVRWSNDGRVWVEDILGEYSVADPSILETTGI